MTTTERERRGPAGRYDLAVAYRIYPMVSKPALSLPFGDDKLRLADICLRSFKNSLGSLRVKVWAILDGCPKEYRDLFERYFATEDLVFIDLPGVGNRATFNKQIDVLLSQGEVDLVYFAEDDYVYLPGQFPLMLDFLHNGKDVDFITPYDCPHYYDLDLHREPVSLTVFADRHWRTAASTCLTFLTRRSTLARYERVFRKYSRPSDDFPLWLGLTKRRIFSPLALYRYLVSREFYWSALVKAWLFCWPQILFGKTAKLWVPVPGIATQWCACLFSPGFDWFSFVRAGARFDTLPATSASHAARLEGDTVSHQRTLQETEKVL